MNNLKYKIRNFRIFDKEGAEFSLAPITVLTGCNSSGKSSMVKSLLVIDSYLRNLSKQKFYDNLFDPSETSLDLSNERLKLGGFDATLNWSEKEHGNRCISFEYVFIPPFVGKEVRIIYDFEPSSHDRKGNGWIRRVSAFLERNDRKIFSFRFGHDDSTATIEYLDLNSLKDSYFKYLSIYKRSCELSGLDPERAKFRFKEQLEPVERLLYSITDKSNRFKIERKEFNGIDINIQQNLVFALKNIEKYSNLDKKSTIRRFDNAFETLGLSIDVDLPKYIQFREALMDSDCTTLFQFISELEESAFVIHNKKVERDGLIPCILNFWSENDNKSMSDYNLVFEFFDRLQFKLRTIHDKTNDKIAIIANIPNNVMSLPFFKFAAACVSDIVFPSWAGNLTYVNSERSSVKRLYTLDDSTKDSFESLISNYLDSIKEYEDTRKSIKNEVLRSLKPGFFINKWCRLFGIGYSLDIKQADDNLGFKILVHNNEQDETGHLLASEGYGMTQLLSIIISIEQAIFRNAKKHDNYLYMTNGFAGFPYFLAVEEPENHLHPRLQSLLAEMFLDATSIAGIHFIIETHSEYLIRKLQLLTAQKKIDNDQVSLYYIYDKNPDNRPEGKPQIENIKVLPNGRLESNFGPGFFDESLSLIQSLISNTRSDV